MKRKLIMFLPFFLAGMGVVTAQTQVRGTVADKAGESVIGATIHIKGTTQGTVTDIDGNFSLSAPANGILVFSHVGYETLEMPVSTTVHAVLQEDSEILTELVVIGYGTGRKISSTVGSVVNVSSEEISEKPMANPLDALQGKVPGLQVYTSTGEPSAISSVRLHGVGSLGASSTPLYVLDGVPISSGTLLGLNSQDFESVTVLKDASATSIYGARAANGVIYITTKKGKTGEKATVSIKAQYGRSSLANTNFFEQMMNTEELTDFWVETGYRTQEQVNELLAEYPHDTRWYKYYYKDSAPTYQTDLSISGGAGNTTYYISGSYFYQDGLAYRSDFDRYTLRANIDSRVNNWMRIGLNSSIGYEQYQTNPYGGNQLNRGLSMLAQPFYSPYDENGEEYPNLIPGWNQYNPKYLADIMPSPNEDALLNTSGYIQLNPAKGLTLRSQMGLEANDYTSSYMRYPSYLGSLDYGEASEAFERNVNKSFTNTVEYKFSPARNHNLTALAGHEFIDYDYEYFSAESAGHNNDNLMLLSNGTEGNDSESAKSEYAFLSYFGRIEYDFAEKYFLDISLRNDASSRFGVNNRSALFWSAGTMWHAKKEKFLKDLNWLNRLTFKLSVGTSGNAEIGNYASYSLVGASSQYNSNPAWYVSTPGNPNLSWEEQTKSTFGISIGIFDRVWADIEIYNRITSDMLMDVPYPYTSGFSEITENVGKLQNRGVDINISVDVWKDGNDNHVTPYLNFNYNKDKVLELFREKEYWIVPNTGVCYAVGQPVSFFHPIFSRVNPDTGAPEWFVPDENISVNREDPANVTSEFNSSELEQNTGISLYPPINGGFGLSASHSGFYLQADFSFSLGKYLIVNDKYFFENPTVFSGYNQRKNVSDYWKQPGDETEFPSLDHDFTQFDSRMIENASFTRLKNLTVGYNVPEDFIRKTNFFKQAKVFVTGRNLLTFTKFDGVDPEVDSNLTLGVNPNTKQISAGFELTF